MIPSSPARAPRARAGAPTRPPELPFLDAVLRLWAEQGGTREFEVTGSSMHPILEGIQRLRARMGSDRVGFGDIVLFYRGGNLIAHRVVRRTAGGVVTRGDSTRGFDPGPLPRHEILGVVTDLLWGGRVVPLGGPGGRLLRPLLGTISLAAGALRIAPPGAARAGTVLGRLRDATAGPAYRVTLRAIFRTYAAASRASRRISRALPRREHRVLLAWLRPHAASRPAGGWGEPRRFARHAVRLGMAPMLWHHLKTEGAAGRLPADVARDLERTWYAQALYNSVALNELAGIVADLSARGVTPVVLKGAALAGRLYEGIALRTLSDLDILVRPEEMAAADRVLRARGYVQRRSPEADSFYAGHHHAAPYLPPRGGPRVEVHSGLVDPRQPLRPDVEAMRARARPARFGEAPALVFRPEDQLLHAALHLSLSDRFVRGVKDLTDLDLLARLEGFDWDLLVASAEGVALGRPIYYALLQARDVFGTPVPGPAWDRLRRHRLPWLEHRLLRATTRLYLTALSEPEEFFGMATAKGLAGVLLIEPRARRRWAWIARRLAGRAVSEPARQET